ncbi:pyrroline-5-carboxylate reductase dimerization domain-containing protein [Streptomyces sp. MCAF7]
MAAAVTIDCIETHLPDDVAVARAALSPTGRGGVPLAFAAAGSRCRAADLAKADLLFAPSRQVRHVSEQQLAIVTAICETGPAYLYCLVESMVEAGVYLGLGRPGVADLAIQAVSSAAEDLRETRVHPALLREQVTSPSGPAAAALRGLEVHGMRAAVMAATEAAVDRVRAHT